MHRPSAASLLVVLVLAACAPSASVEPAPAPAPATDEPGVQSPVSTLPAAAATETEIASELEAARDSALDAEALEELAAAHPAGGDSILPVAIDLDVSAYAGHDRVRYYLDFFTGPGRERMRIWLERLPRYEGMIRARLAEQGLPGELIYLALIESGFSNRAVSRASAVGMWQFMAPTGRGYGLRIDQWLDERRDPVKSTAAAARHLRDLQERFGSVYLAAAAYNGGAGRVGRGLNALGGGDDEEIYSDAGFFRLYNSRLIYRETKDYVPKLIAATIIGREPARYGFTIDRPEAPFEADSVHVTGMTGLDVIAELADTSMAEIRELNPAVLRLVTPPSTEFVVLVPEGRGPMAQARYDSLPAEAHVSFRRHTVERGESLEEIAEAYGTSVEAIKEANPGTRSAVAGRRLVVPVGGPSSIVVARSFAEPAQPAVRIHRVRSGETLSHIARRYGVSVRAIQNWNGLSSTRIRAGQRLRIGATPTERARVASGRTHTVRPGETLSGLAQRFGVSLSTLSRANGLTTRSRLRIGQRLRIPG